jgi:hypothetical protein
LDIQVAKRVQRSLNVCAAASILFS